MLYDMIDDITEEIFQLDMLVRTTLFKAEYVLYMEEMEESEQKRTYEKLT